MFAYSIFDSFKSLYESFDFWIERIQEGAVFFPKYFQSHLESSAEG